MRTNLSTVLYRYLYLIRIDKMYKNVLGLPLKKHCLYDHKSGQLLLFRNRCFVVNTKNKYNISLMLHIIECIPSSFKQIFSYIDYKLLILIPIVVNYFYVLLFLVIINWAWPETTQINSE